jgi:hypothetical protein
MEIIVMATSQTQASNFEFKATADFNGDGKPDIFCRDQATGQNEGVHLSFAISTNT